PLSIDGAKPVILQLTDSGVLTEIPVPDGGPRRPVAKSGRTGRSSRGAKGRRAAPAEDGSDPASPKSGNRDKPGPRRPRARKSLAAEGAPAKAPEGFGAATLGACPLCGS